MYAEKTAIGGNLTNNYMNKQIDIVIPAYNEEKRIKPVLEDLTSFIHKNNLNWRIIVSVDGNDGTKQIVKDLMLDYSFILLSTSSGRSGKGNAIKRVLPMLDSEYTILMDADNSIEFKTILINMKNALKYDIAIFSRYVNSDNKIPFYRRFISRGFNFLVNSILSIKVNDTQSGYKIIRTDLFKKSLSKVGVTNTFFDIDLIYYLRSFGATIIEIPVKYIHAAGSTFNPFTEIIGQAASLVAFRIRHSRAYKYIPNIFVQLYYKLFKYI